MISWGSVPSGAVLPFFFDSYAGATGASVTLTGLALGDILCYKGTSMTQRASTAGFVLLDTDGIDVDAITGIHGFSIDTGDNTDAGFYAVGSFFTVVVSAVTIDAQTVNFVAGTFRLLAIETVSGTPQARASAVADGAISATTLAADTIAAAKIATGAITAAKFAAGAIDAASIAADAITAAKIADGAIDAATFAAGAINAAAIAADAIGASELATDAVAEIVNAVWDETTAEVRTAGTYGQLFKDNVNATIGSRAIPGDLMGIVAGGITAAKFTAGAIDAAAIAADAIGASELAADAVTEIQSGLATAAALTTVNNFIDTEVAAILAAVDTEVAAILALLDDARGEPAQGAPPVNPDLATKIDYLYKAFRNRITQTATQLSIYADDAVTVDHKAAVSDDAVTFSRGELATGP